MAQIDFFAGVNQITNTGGSGLGFYGSTGFGYSVLVGGYQGRTFITDSTGTAQGPEAWNNTFLNTSGVLLGQSGSGINLLQLPNYQASLNIRFSHSVAIQTQNVKLYGYDRVSKNNNPSGVDIYAAQIIHPNTVQGLSGSGSANWVNLKGSGTTLTMASSPGTSGYSPNGPSTSDARHDWFVAMTASPQSVGAKLFGAFFELEYL